MINLEDKKEVLYTEGLVINPDVKLLHHTPLKVADIAIGNCWDKQRGDDEIDFDRMYKVANKFKHASTIEHINYNFSLKNISRAVLIELSRHRIASYSVKSTRYTLKELKNEKPFIEDVQYIDNELFIKLNPSQVYRAGKYLIFTGDFETDKGSILELEVLRNTIVKNVSNDKAKYNLPESYKTEIAFTINARSLQNFLDLRTNKAALWEIRKLAYTIFDSLPESHKFLYTKLPDEWFINAKKRYFVRDELLSSEWMKKHIDVISKGHNTSNSHLGCWVNDDEVTLNEFKDLVDEKDFRLNTYNLNKTCTEGVAKDISSFILGINDKTNTLQYTVKEFNIERIRGFLNVYRKTYPNENREETSSKQS